LIDAAKKVKIQVIGVSWGFNYRSMLAAHEPDFFN
jgi:phosphoglycolate phosphatase-like HAD superfamily hydrolase